MTYEEYVARQHFGSAATVVDSRVFKTVTPTRGEAYTMQLGYFTEHGEMFDSTGDSDRKVRSGVR